jgi:hypothetical protein
MLSWTPSNHRANNQGRGHQFWALIVLLVFFVTALLWKESDDQSNVLMAGAKLSKHRGTVRNFWLNSSSILFHGEKSSANTFVRNVSTTNHGAAELRVATSNHTSAEQRPLNSSVANTTKMLKQNTRNVQKQPFKKIGRSPPVRMALNSEDCHQDLHFCTRSSITVENTSVSEFVSYFCTGEKYNFFSEKLNNFVSNSTSCWGRRSFPIPANKTVLVIGNSHTRQVLQALLCQYKAELLNLDRIPDAEGGYGNAYRAAFRNGATLYGLSNVALVYSKKWVQLIESFVLENRKLDSIDAIVLGTFNGVGDSINTAFGRIMSNMTKFMGPDINFETNEPPSLSTVLKKFRGPIIFVGMFAGDHRHKRTKEAIQLVKHLQQRDNVVALDARKYVDILGECATDSSAPGGICYGKGDDTNGSRPAISMHRCGGKNGGHADLIAWDVIEEVNRLLTPGHQHPGLAASAT